MDQEQIESFRSKLELVQAVEGRKGRQQLGDGCLGSTAAWVELGEAGNGGGFVDRRRWFTGLGCSAGRGGGQGSSLVSGNEQRRRRASLSWRLLRRSRRREEVRAGEV
ncbi:hypothetical protein M0R45_017429 [Rubus argutus]|uniref:Uncharacterized protein n=1 Tax=Rubus argutus TaxID=59490 RepID=A0AAW1XW66_RUBAR